MDGRTDPLTAAPKSPGPGKSSTLQGPMSTPRLGWGQTDVQGWGASWHWRQGIRRLPGRPLAQTLGSQQGLAGLLG